MPRLTGLDAGFLYMETPAVHMHTLKLVVFDQLTSADDMDFELIRAAIDAHLPSLPPLRKRVHGIPGRLHHPVWVDDPDFDIEHHVHHEVLPAPGSHAQLDRRVGQLAGRPLDLSLPLWQMYVFDGLESGRSAILIVVHHALADGVAATGMLNTVMNEVRASQPDAHAGHGPPPLPGRYELVRSALSDHSRQIVRLPRLFLRTVRGLVSMARHRRRSDVSTPLPMLDTPRASFNTSLTASRSFASISLDLDDAREIKKARGATVNDVVLAVVGGALRTYLLDRGELPSKPLVAAVPMSSDSEPGRLAGNRVTNLFASLATDIGDPLLRLDAIHEVMSEAKTLQEIIGVETLADWTEFTPPGVFSWINRWYSGRNVADRLPPPINVIVSNVPGPDEKLRLVDSTLEEIYSVGPVLEGVGLNITVWSYCNRLYVGVLGCGATVPEPALITKAMADSLDELLALVRQSSDEFAV